MHMDRVLVINEVGRETMIGYGVPENRVICVGSPEYDDLATSLEARGDTDPRPTAVENLGLPPDQPVVLFAHQEILGFKAVRSTIRQIVDGCQRANASLLVKMHPRAPDAEVKRLSTAFTNEERMLIVRDECTSLEASLASSVCITAYSTVALEALICRRPIVLLPYLSSRYRLSYVSDYGVGIDVGSADELPDAVHRAVTDSDARRTWLSAIPAALEREIGVLDGRSIERTVEAILEVTR
jgi:CDP-glycerol glycerophosphotransferase (TagB/SpsB family)